MTGLRIVLPLRRLRARTRRATRSDVLGRCERAALAAALWLRHQTGGHVTAVAVGPAKLEKRALDMALRAGCDRAIEVLYPGVDAVDYLGVARVLAAVARRETFDVVIIGNRSQDELVGAVGPAVAELLDVPHLGSVVDVSVSGDRITAIQRAGGKLHEFSCRPPLVACVEAFSRSLPAAARPADRAEIAEIELGALDIRATELSVRTDFAGSARSSRVRAATIVSGAAELMRRLAGDNRLGR